MYNNVKTRCEVYCILKRDKFFLDLLNYNENCSTV